MPLSLAEKLAAAWLIGVEWVRGRLLDSERYWRARASFQAAGLRVWLALYDLFSPPRFTRRSSGALHRLPLSQVVLAVALSVAGCYALDSQLPRIPHRIPLKLIGSLITFKAGLSTGNLAYTIGFGVASITGLLLGLYFTALSSIAQAVFARVPGPIQQLVGNDPSGRQYAWSLAYTTALALTLLVLVSLSLSPSPAGFLLLLGSATWCLFQVLRQGLRLFNFFDPAYIGEQVLARLTRLVAGLFRNRLISWHPEWQALQRSEAVALAEAHGLLVAYAMTFEGRHSLTRLLRSTLRFLERYSMWRVLIPLKTGWYAHAAYHPDTYGAPGWKAAIAADVGAAPSLEKRRERYWLERALLQTSRLGVQDLLDAGRGQDAAIVLTALGEYAGTRMLEAETDLALWCEREFATLRAETSKLDDPDLLAVIETLDRSRTLLVANLEGFLARWNAIDLRRLSSQVAARLTTGYSTAPWPRGSQALFEEVQAQIDLEQSVDRTTVTSEHAIAQVYQSWMARHVVSTTGRLLELVASSVDVVLESERSQDVPLKVRALDLLYAGGDLTRMRGAVSRVEAWLAELQGGRPGDPDWPRFSSGPQDTRLRALARRVARARARLLPELEPLEHVDSERPWFGDAVAATIQSAFGALREGDEAHLAELLQYLVPAVMALQRRALGALSTDTPSVEIMSKLGPLVELLELSGHSWAWAALHTRPILWALTCAAWDAWLKQEGFGGLSWISNIYDFLEGGIAVPPRYEFTFRWIRVLEDEIEKLPRRPIRTGGGMVVGEEPDHPDGVIRSFRQDFPASRTDLRDVFAVKYLRRRCEAGALPFGHVHEHHGWARR